MKHSTPPAGGDNSPALEERKRSRSRIASGETEHRFLLNHGLRGRHDEPSQGLISGVVENRESTKKQPAPGKSLAVLFNFFPRMLLLGDDLPEVDREPIRHTAAWRLGSSGLSSQRRPPVASQTVKQPRIPPLWTVIADGYAKRLLLPDQHEQPLAPRDPRVDQVAL